MSAPADATTRQAPARGRIFDIKRFALHDGPGIRTTVFFKGCPLRCAWCHNPEGVAVECVLSFMSDRCVGCGYCFRACPHGAHQMIDGRHVLVRASCVGCGLCAVECRGGALELVGREVGVAEVIAEVLRDRPYYDATGGGMTLSGGEPTMQIDFAAELLTAGKAESLHTCLDTCGHCDWARLDRLRPLVDLFLYDWKETDPKRHLDLTGVGNETILDNLRRLHAAGSAIRLRCPIIPGLNDRPDHFEGIARLAAELKGLEGVELLPYHRLGEGKERRFGADPAARTRSARPDAKTVAGWIARLAALGVRVIDPEEQ